MTTTQQVYGVLIRCKDGTEYLDPSTDAGPRLHHLKRDAMDRKWILRSAMPELTLRVVRVSASYTFDSK